MHEVESGRAEWDDQNFASTLPVQSSTAGTNCRLHLTCISHVHEAEKSLEVRWAPSIDGTSSAASRTAKTTVKFTCILLDH